MAAVDKRKGLALLGRRMRKVAVDKPVVAVDSFAADGSSVEVAVDIAADNSPEAGRSSLMTRLPLARPLRAVHGIFCNLHPSQN